MFICILKHTDIPKNVRKHTTQVLVAKRKTVETMWRMEKRKEVARENKKKKKICILTFLSKNKFPQCDARLVTPCHYIFICLPIWMYTHNISQTCTPFKHSMRMKLLSLVRCMMLALLCLAVFFFRSHAPMTRANGGDGCFAILMVNSHTPMLWLAAYVTHLMVFRQGNSDVRSLTLATHGTLSANHTEYQEKKRKLPPNNWVEGWHW